MKKFTLWIVKKIIKNHESIGDLEVRNQYGMLEGWTSIVINILVFVIKLLLGITIHSVALIGDAIHTLSDSVTSVVVIVGFKMAKKPSDKEHPFGHGRMESVATLVVSVLLFSAGIEVFEKSFRSILHPQVGTASLAIILVIVATILIKELLARFSFSLGDMINSSILKADGLHHRTDALSTILVVTALVASYFGYHRVDGVMGVVVSFFIFYSAYVIAKEAIDPLLGAAPSKEDIKKIEKVARKHEGVLGVHDIIFHKYGQTNIISFHIEVSDKDPVSHLHDLSEEVEADIVKTVGGMAVVHIDPVNRDHPQYEAIAQTIKTIISEDSRVNSFHELRIVGGEVNRCNVIFDIALEQEVDEQETYDITHSIDRKFRQKFPLMKTVIKAEPKYAYNL